MVTVFVKELDREVEVVEVSGCPVDPYTGEYYCYDADEVADYYEQGKVYFDEFEGHFYVFDSEMDDVVVATFKELN